MSAEISSSRDNQRVKGIYGWEIMNQPKIKED